jgi:hypothetical protein
MTDLWSYVNSINYEKKDLTNPDNNDDYNMGQYAPFIVNRTLSKFPDTVLYANEMNMNAHLTKPMQFSYLMHSIRAKKRFGEKKEKIDTSATDIIKEYYQCSTAKAEMYNKVLSALEIKELQARMETGGLKK